MGRETGTEIGAGRTRVIALVLALATFTAVAAVAAPTAGADDGDPAEDCDVAATSWDISSNVHAELDQRFAAFGNDRRGWTGGDSTYSVQLTEDRTVWLFSDTFVGPVNDDLTQPLDTGFVNSSMVVQHNDKLVRTVTGGTPADPVGLLAPPENGWFWLGSGHLTDAGSLDIMFLEFSRFGDGQWDWGWEGNVLGRFSPTSLKLQEIVAMPSGNDVQWASWIEQGDTHTYVYGVEDQGLTKYMHLARVAGDDLTGTWEYWTGDGWSTDEADSVRIMDGVANEYSVAAFGDGYLLVTQDTHELFSTNIVAYISCSPEGPFERVGTLYSTPETGADGSYGDPNVFTYNAHEHPHLRDGTSLTLSYNVNTFVPDDLYDDVTIYRPRFVEVDLAPTDGDPT